jgi:DNA segregation ATPase FtsK/SpoIIIE, S-DNA-T family
MRANIKLRLCLRVEQMDTSRELLRRPDAALLPNGMPGRGYLQIGNENLELVQVSYTGEVQPDDRTAAVLWPARPRGAQPQADEEPPKLFDMAVQLALELANGQAAPKPWPAFLPERFSLETALLDAQRNQRFTLTDDITDWLNGDTAGLWPGVDWREGALRPVVGLVDDPAEARQDALRFDLGRGHLAVFGDSGMGKTTLLRTILVSLAATHAPSELHAYILDLGGRNFRSLEGLPHVGAVIYADEETFEERLQRLLETLNRIVDERQQLFSAADCSGLYDYNERNPAQALPAIVVLIDNFAELQENYENLVETSLMPLARRSLSIGMILVVAANLHTHMPSRLFSLFGERVTFKQASTDNYLDIVGRGAVEIGDIAGRGYIRKDRRPLMFHIALPAGLLDAEGRATRPEAEELRMLGARMQAAAAERGPYTQPDPVHVLAEQVPLAAMLREAGQPQGRRVQAVLGQGGDLRPALFDLKRSGPHFMIVGPPLSGKTTTLYNWALSLADRYTPDQVRFVLIDLQRKFVEYGGARTLADLPHVLACIDEIEQLDDLLVRLKAECAALVAEGADRAIYVLIDNFDDFTEEIENQRTLARDISALVRRYGRDGLHFVAAGTPEGGASELKRRVQAANYGIGLRTAGAVEALRVMRTPPALRNKELPIGRGFIVKAGQATMLQLANPYDESGAVAAGDGDDDEKRARALDAWVEQLCARYPEQRAAWSAAPDRPGGPSEQAPAERQKADRVRALVWAGVRREVEHLKQGNGAEELIIEKIAQLDAEGWNSPDVRLGLLRELYLKEQVALGMDIDTVKMMADLFDEESLLLALEGENSQ